MNNNINNQPTVLVGDANGAHIHVPVSEYNTVWAGLAEEVNRPDGKPYALPLRFGVEMNYLLGNELGSPIFFKDGRRLELSEVSPTTYGIIKTKVFDALDEGKIKLAE